MLKIKVTTAEAVIQETEIITAGRRGLVCGFEFDSAWDGLVKTVVVVGVVKRDINLLGDSITVPGECLTKENFPVRIGVYGATGDGTIAIPTVWANFGRILPSAQRSDIPPDELTPDLVSQIQQNANNALYLAQNVSNRANSGEFNGVSPTVLVSSITGGHEVAITDLNGTQQFDVMDGVDGADGEGVPTGGTTGQYLRKASGTDYDTEWATMPEEVFWAVRGTTTSAQIEAAYQAGKVVCCSYNKRVYRLSNRESATDHYFTCIGGNSSYSLRCNNDSWGTATVFNLALSASVPSAATSAPADLGTAAVGSSSKYAKADHVHKMPSASDVGAIGDPGGGTTGQVLKKTADGTEWANESGGGGGTPYDSNPAALGTASPGSSAYYSRGDHVHENNIFLAVYGTTTSADIEAAYQAGKIVFCKSANDLLFFSLTYRESATKHHFTRANGDTLYTYICNNNVWSDSSKHIPSSASSAPKDLAATAAIGSSANYARQDHVHKMPSASDVGAVAVAQGVGHAGEFLVVGSDGDVTTVTLATWQGGSF